MIGILADSADANLISRWKYGEHNQVITLLVDAWQMINRFTANCLQLIGGIIRLSNRR